MNRRFYMAPLNFIDILTQGKKVIVIFIYN